MIAKKQPPLHNPRHLDSLPFAVDNGEMQTIALKWLVVVFLASALPLVLGAKSRTQDIRVGGHTPRQILKLFGFKGTQDITDRQVADYRRVFGFLDANRDGRHSKKEYIEDGIHLNPQARQGIFRASDTNRDGFVSRAEYVENRIITDEAKEIFYQMDVNRDGRLTLKELVGAGKFKDEKLAKAVFEALDSNGNEELVIPEYLHVWGHWARS